MDAQLWIKIIVCLGIVALLFKEKIMDVLREKMLLTLSKSGYYRWVIGITVLIVFLIAFNSGPSISSYEDPAQKEISHKVSTAFEAAKKAVKAKLKSPSSAKFASQADNESKYKINDDGSVIIQSYVDADNSFGANIRTFFRCTVDRLGEVKDISTWE
ncbi:hypothetical protein [Bacteroides intestinalis]|uniref:hypothetical protein n=1 Tax=Bacteroides intestinalis TaxID=329854 RepID=UPI00189C9206|nr:hypothetical protein [Bacteroides intestinalis]